MTVSSRPPLPFSVIGGFLGAGKTTLLNHVLRHTSERIAVLVNDFGATPIDADLVASHDGDTIALANGCVCCSIAGELALTLAPLPVAEPPFDRVVVEASGIADPRAIGQYGTTPGFRLDGVVVLADASAVTDLLADDRIGAQVARQLRRADLIVLNKSDLVDRGRRARIESELGSRFPAVPVIHAAHGELPLEVLFDLDSGAATPDPETALDLHGFETITIKTREPVGRSRLEEIARRLPNGVIRAKGIVAGPSGEMWTLHLVGTSVRLTARHPEVQVPSSTGRIVVIGLAGTFDGYRPPTPFDLVD
jgi:G3E family GTPase